MMCPPEHHSSPTKPGVHETASEPAGDVEGLGPRLDNVRGRVADGRHGEGQVDAEQRVESALVGAGPPHVLQQVPFRGRAPARRAEEAQAEVDDKGKACGALTGALC